MSKFTTRSTLQDQYLFFAGIIPGPSEPTVTTLNHILDPLVNEFLQLDKGVIVASQRYPDGRRVRARLVPVIADLVAIRKATGFAAHSAKHFCSYCTLQRDSIERCDVSLWSARTHSDVLKASRLWKTARTVKRRDTLFKASGVRYSALHRLVYRNTVDHNVLGIMHNWMEGVLQHHLRRKWGIGAETMRGRKKGSNKAKLPEYASVSVEGSIEDIEDFQKELESLQSESREHNDVPVHHSSRHRNLAPSILHLSDDGDSDDSDFSQDDPFVSESEAAGDIGMDQTVLNSSTRKDRSNRLLPEHSLATETILGIRAAISEIFLPTWIDRPPRNLGSPAHGKLKADTYFVLFTAILPLDLVERWSAQARHQGLLENLYDLVTCTNIACSYSTNLACANIFEQRYEKYRLSSTDLFTHTHSMPNHHYASHIPKQLMYWGPLMRLSEFGLERQNGVLQKISTNGHLCKYMYLFWVRQVTDVAYIR